MVVTIDLCIAKEQRWCGSCTAAPAKEDGFMRFLTVVGARSQFTKAALLSAELRKSHMEYLAHWAKRFDISMES